MQPFGLIPVLEDDDLTLFGMLSFFLFQLIHFFTLHHPLSLFEKYTLMRAFIFIIKQILLGKKYLFYVISAREVTLKFENFCPLTFVTNSKFSNLDH